MLIISDSAVFLKMDEFRNFFGDPCPSKSQVQRLRGGLTGGIRITNNDPIDELSRREDHRRAVVPTGTDYAREVKQRETEMYIRNEIERPKWESMSGGLESLEQLSSFGASVPNLGELTEEAMTEVYSKYSFKKREDAMKLAIDEFKQEILDRINGFPVVIIEGPTGCGKTTQVPQWILDDSYKKRKPCKVIVTQPRRIAAISIAKRVAHERGWDVGGLVGYQVGLDSKTSADTRISYVTTGILLQKLVNNKTMNEYTHIILDEIHERGQEMDFLLLIVRRLLYTVSPRVKIILMSATFKKKTFADYFSLPSPTTAELASCIEVVKKEPTFSVKIFYLNQLAKFGSILQQATPKEEPAIAPEMHHLVLKLINAFEQIDKQEDRYEDRSSADLPSVLVFLPGINEIEDLFLCLNDPVLRAKIGDAECPKYNWWVLPLHSTITAEEQVKVFKRAPPGHRKIILATNIAESSITVPDIKYVIDYCLIKQLVADPSTNFTSLQLTWASKTNCEQRAGRAGRVRDGRVYRLVSDKHYRAGRAGRVRDGRVYRLVSDKHYENFNEECRPEILRCPLERLVLLAKMLNIGPPSDTLALAMDPPDMSNIHRTILVLKEIGGLKKTLDGEWCQSDGDMTYLGRIMAKLPLDVRASKLIVLGHIFGCLEESIIMAASMSVKNIFSSPFRERLNAYNSKLTWADGSTSDCIAHYNVYKVWNYLRQQQHFKQQGQNEAQWARRFYLQVRSLKELDDLVRELKMRLSREGIEIQQGSSPWPHQEQTIALKPGQNSAQWARRFYLQVRSLKELDDLVRELKMRLSREGIEIQQGSSPWPHQEQTIALKRGQNSAQWARRFYLQVRSLKELDDLVRELKMRLSREGIEIQQGSSPWPHQEQTIALKQQGQNEAQWARRFYLQVRSLKELDDLVRELKMRLSREGIEIQQGSSPWPHQEQTLALKQGHNSAEWARRFYLQVRSLKELDDLVRELKMRLSREGIEIQQGSSPWPHQEQTLALKQGQNSAQWTRRFYLQVRSLKELDDLVRELKMRLSREGIEIQQGSSPWPHQEQTIALKNSAQWARRFYLQVRSLKELDDLVRELKMRLSREGIEIQQGSSPWPHQEQTIALKLSTSIPEQPDLLFKMIRLDDSN
ncbi:helicase associated domain (HA2) domain-containing protein [Phthorimaea operculella]|nr:helicase associated domain (HA2) domain-containing protein [Phthorimaea operculella]